MVNAETGAVEQEMEYDAWGKVTKDTAPGKQPFGFAGGMYDGGVGLVHFGAREYDPEARRWLQKEPLGFAGGLNFYSYANNDPVNWVDWDGTKPHVPYNSPLEAALAALSEYNPWSAHDPKGREVAGLLYEKGGKFCHTNGYWGPEPTGLSKVSHPRDARPEIPWGATEIGDFHTHPEDSSAPGGERDRRIASGNTNPFKLFGAPGVAFGFSTSDSFSFQENAGYNGGKWLSFVSTSSGWLGILGRNGGNYYEFYTPSFSNILNKWLGKPGGKPK